jgi:hypothetical protein
LPIALIPEQFEVAFMSLDVIDYTRLDGSSFSRAG